MCNASKSTCCLVQEEEEELNDGEVDDEEDEEGKWENTIFHGNKYLNLFTV